METGKETRYQQFFKGLTSAWVQATGPMRVDSNPHVSTKDTKQTDMQSTMAEKINSKPRVVSNGLKASLLAKKDMQQQKNQKARRARAAKKAALQQKIVNEGVVKQEIKLENK